MYKFKTSVAEKSALLNPQINFSTDLHKEWNWKVPRFNDNRHFTNISLWSLLNDNRPSLTARYKLSFGKTAYPNAAIYIMNINIYENDVRKQAVLSSPRRNMLLVLIWNSI